MYFEKNVGQARVGVRFIARAGSDTIAVSDDLSISLAGGVRMTLAGACAAARATASAASHGKTNYLLGNDQSRWLRGVQQYGRIEIGDVLDGVDLILRGDEGALEYDFVVRPGADPRAIRMQFDGADEVTIDGSGDLLIRAGDAEIRHRRPAVYQSSGGIDGAYILHADGTVGFQIGAYDREARLIIDPVLVSSVRVGTATSCPLAIAVDASANLYITGEVTTPPWMDLGSGGGVGDAFVSKFNAAGSLQYTTYIGGSAEDFVHAIAADANGRVFVAGETLSSNFPVTDEGQTVFGGVRDGMLFALDSGGSTLLYSTYMGGSDHDEIMGIALDPARNLFVTGNTSSSDFPSSDPCSGSSIFVGKFNTFGQRQWARCFGGNGGDTATGIAVDRFYVAHITGDTNSTDFPAAYLGFQTTLGGLNDAFVATLNSNGSVAWATYWGGNGNDEALSIAVDRDGAVYASGMTNSTDFPSRGPVLAGAKGQWDAFVMKILRGHRVVSYARLIGGDGNDVGSRVIADDGGCAYLAGETYTSATFETKAALFPAGGSMDTFLAKFSPAGETIYSMPFGGSGLERWGQVALTAGATILAGQVKSTNFPLLPDVTPQPAAQTFILKLTEGPAFSVPARFTANAGSSQVALSWLPVSGASGYVIQKRLQGGGSVFIGPVTNAFFTDVTVSSGSAYLYRVATVEAFDADGPFSAWDLATLFSATDDPVVAGSTTIKAAHLQEIRAAADVARAFASLPPYGYANAIAAGVVSRWTDVSETQRAINDARMALGLSHWPFTAPFTGTLIVAGDINGLRDALR